ncbi:DUF3618 domain-containing protein [Goodfellowiella coeruleoviolacea]|uniref:DUF3618 domain-containing protein n=1 Tax=Goodfellowiella coeruleoviolacea TaxID=334858 RepID=A0AAE3KHF6_9PSEU|nr:DUF3618 domain-containing protein [Goodfellowiella coeruleoviolacea]MCP2166399.1 Protein of unknown function (DUF3618) [Goodfellowiella coeruleoviolacea]
MSTSQRRANDVPVGVPPQAREHAMDMRPITPDQADIRPSDSPRMAELRADAALTREELGETVEALAHKMNVPRRAKEQLDQRKAALQARTEQTLNAMPPPVANLAQQGMAAVRRRPAAFLVGTVVAVLVLRMMARRRGSR